MMLVDGEAGRGVPPDDRGLAYGDGVFETLYAADGRVPLLDRHLARLRAGAERLGIEPPAEAAWQGDLKRLLPANGRAALKFVLTRGSDGRGYRPTRSAPPRRIALVDAWPSRPDSWWTAGIALRVCATRVDASPALAGLKHLNRLPQVLARAEWDAADVAEGLMLDVRGTVVGGTMTNLFVMLDGALRTPSASAAGVAGIARGLVIERLGARECELELAALARAEEMFVTNALIGAWPVRRFDDRELRPGAQARAAQAALRDAGLPC